LESHDDRDKNEFKLFKSIHIFVTAIMRLQSSLCTFHIDFCHSYVLLESIFCLLTVARMIDKDPNKKNEYFHPLSLNKLSRAQCLHLCIFEMRTSHDIYEETDRTVTMKTFVKKIFRKRQFDDEGMRSLDIVIDSHVSLTESMGLEQSSTGRTKARVVLS